MPPSVKATVPLRLALLEVVLAVKVMLCPNTAVVAEAVSVVLLLLVLLACVTVMLCTT